MEMWKIFQVWEENLDNAKKTEIRSLIESELSLFFSYNKELYGCPEESRLVFAKLKAKDTDVAPEWHEEAGFLAFNLSRAMTTEEIPKRLFYKKDLKTIKIIDKDQIIKDLKLGQ